MLRHVLVAETDEAAMALARPAFEAHYESFTHLWRVHGSDRFTGPLDFDGLVAEHKLFVGSPETVATQVARARSVGEINYFAGAFAWGSLDVETVLTSVRLFRDEVIPAVRADTGRDPAGAFPGMPACRGAARSEEGHARPRDGDGATVHRDVVYSSVDGLELRLDLYVPDVRPAPLCIWLHGGGWLRGSRSDRADERLVPLARSGVAVAAVQYRLSGQASFPAPLDDARAAVRWLRAHAHDYGLDAARVGAWGASAGGHLASLLALTDGETDADRATRLCRRSSPGSPRPISCSGTSTCPRGRSLPSPPGRGWSRPSRRDCSASRGCGRTGVRLSRRAR